MHAIKLDDGNGEKCAESVPQLTAGVQYGGPEGNLLAIVKHRQVEEGPREEGRFDKSEHESTCEKPSKGRDGSCAGGDCTPDCNSSAYIDGWQADLRHNHVAGDLHQDCRSRRLAVISTFVASITLTVADEEDADRRIVLGVGHPQGLLDTGQSTGRNVLTVQVVQDVHDHHGWHDDHVKLHGGLSTKFANLILREAHERGRQSNTIIASDRLLKVFDMLHGVFCIRHGGASSWQMMDSQSDTGI